MGEAKFGIKGEVTFIVETLDGCKHIFKNRNTVTLDGLYTIAQGFLGACGSSIHFITGNPYIAVGDDDTYPQPSDTVLGNELLRKKVEDIGMVRTNKNMYFEIQIEPNEGLNSPYWVFKECGLFIDGASATPDSGKLVARTLFAPEIEKTEYKRLTIRWALKVERIE